MSQPNPYMEGQGDRPPKQKKQARFDGADERLINPSVEGDHMLGSHPKSQDDENVFQSVHSAATIKHGP